jgi:hypothetical protein
MRFRLRTLLIVLALGPPVLAWAWVGYFDYLRYRDRLEQERIAAEQEEMDLVMAQLLYDTSRRTVWQGKLLDDLNINIDECH